MSNITTQTTQESAPAEDEFPTTSDNRKAEEDSDLPTVSEVARRINLLGKLILPRAPY